MNTNHERALRALRRELHAGPCNDTVDDASKAAEKHGDFPARGTGNRLRRVLAQYQRATEQLQAVLDDILDAADIERDEQAAKGGAA